MRHPTHSDFRTSSQLQHVNILPSEQSIDESEFKTFIGGKSLTSAQLDQERLQKHPLQLKKNEILDIQYYRNQVYVPEYQTYFGKTQISKIEDQFSSIEQVSTIQPELQNKSEVQRLLDLNKKMVSKYNHQMQLRRGITGNRHKNELTKNLKKTLETNNYFNIDDTPEGRAFKRDYLNLQDVNKLAGSYHPSANKYFRSALYYTSNPKTAGVHDNPYNPDEELERLPPLFKTEEQLYESIQVCATLKGIELQEEMQKRAEQNQMQFMTEVDEGKIASCMGGSRVSEEELNETEQKIVQQQQV